MKHRGLLLLLLAYGAASLVHHIHNAAFLEAYPNMPGWLSPGAIYAAWAAVTAVGLAGYLLFRRGYSVAGLALLAVYAAYGFDSLGHYALGPVSAHTAATNLTIGLEVAAAALLVIAVALRIRLRN